MLQETEQEQGEPTNKKFEVLTEKSLRKEEISAQDKAIGACSRRDVPKPGHQECRLKIPR